ncbi:hypothetical protein BJY04DRAFT_231555 [Aspergillus karnatakaensis]|uniref:uncharacterized protein n=1 Tax=Aspergillus karnatakaensis TaxID=1810916 RepID=UPI003CCE06D7
MHWTAPLLLAVQAASTAMAHLATPTAPFINVTLTPCPSDRNDGYIHGNAILNLPFAENETLVVLPITMAGRPSTQYTNETLKASDNHGSLHLTVHNGTGSDGQPSSFWVTNRRTEGPVVVQFQARPNKVSPDATTGPLFDIRSNGNGFLGSTWALIPLPPNTTTEYQFSLAWDLQNYPSGAAKGVWTWGEGPEPVTITGTVATFLYTFWAVGTMSTYPATPPSKDTSNSTFSMYSLEPVPFNATATATFIDKFFTYSSSFWQDFSGQPYRVFVRRNDDLGTGGTALTRSFTFGWSPRLNTSEDELQVLLAHEITHNWPGLSGATPAATRYAEGTAEYYSLRLLWRNGQISAEKFLAEMNERVRAYYTNSAVDMTDAEAYDVSWENADAQTMPYGRGLIYLVNMDAQIRAVSGGERNLDALALELLEICREDELKCTEEALLALLESYLGEQAVTEYYTVGTGVPLIQPLPDSLGSCFEVVQTGSGPSVFEWRVKEGVDYSSLECLF